MTLRVIKHHLQNAGMPATPRGTRAPQRAVACHVTVSGFTEEDAWAVISWMHATAATRNASYNEFWVFNEATKELLVIEVVPHTYASHSIAPQPLGSTGLPLYEPDAQVRAALGDVVWDPNMWVYAVSIAGNVVDADRFGQYPEFRHAARARLAQIKALGVNTDNLLEHFRFNPRTRSDWGRTLVPALKGTGGPDDMQFWKPVQQDWYTVAKTATALGTVFYDAAGAKKEFTTKERVRSVAESSDGRWRLVKYSTDELLVVDARGNLKEGPGLVPIANTRIPATGFGFPPPEIKTVTNTVEKIVEKIVEVPDPDAVDAAVDGERARIRSVLGV